MLLHLYSKNIVIKYVPISNFYLPFKAKLFEIFNILYTNSNKKLIHIRVKALKEDVRSLL